MGKVPILVVEVIVTGTKLNFNPLRMSYQTSMIQKTLNTIPTHTLTAKIGTGVIMSFRTTKKNYI